MSNPGLNGNIGYVDGEVRNGTPGADNATAWRISNSTLNFDEGNNKLTVAGMISESSITAGSGNDTIICTEGGISNGTVSLGTGNNVYRGNWISGYGDDIFSGGTLVAMGDGKDTFSVKSIAGDATVDLGAGDDRFTADDLYRGAYLDAGTGNDVLKVNGSLEGSTINLGEGNNTLNVHVVESEVPNAWDEEGNPIDGPFVKSAIFGGSGNDRVTVKSDITGSEVGLGDGNNTITIDGGISSAVIAGKTYGASISTGVDEDSITITATGNNVVTMQGTTITDKGSENYLTVIATGEDVTAVANSKITLAGSNFVDIRATKDADEAGTAFRNSNLTLSEGGNLVIMEGEVVNSVITLGKGDRFAMGPAQKASDTAWFPWYADPFGVHDDSNFTNSTLNAKTGWAEVDLQNVINSNLTFGNYVDTLTIHGDIEGKTLISTGGGGDDVQIRGNLAAESTLNLGTGDDFLCIRVHATHGSEIKGSIDGGTPIRFM